MNYGLSQWFDLHHDPQALKDLTDNVTDNLATHEQGALFNQCINPDDLIAHIASSKILFPGVPRSIRIVESGPARVIVENSHHPMLTRKNEKLRFRTRYVIYPDGRIFISNVFEALADQRITLWRNSIVGLSDPTYMVKNDSGVMKLQSSSLVTDSTKSWKRDEWKGFQLTLPNWSSYEIVGNSSDTLTLGRQVAGGGNTLTAGKYKIASSPSKFGWLRGDSVSFPRQWHDKKATFIYASWDPQTPPPYTDWSSASIMLVPARGNEKKATATGIHGWKGFKRVYFEYAEGDLLLSEGEAITQNFMVVLGSNSNERLPDLRSRDVALKQSSLYAAEGCGGLDPASGAMRVNLAERSFYKATDGNPRIFELKGEGALKLRLDGRVLEAGKDYLIQKSSGGNRILLLSSSTPHYDRIDF